MMAGQEHSPSYSIYYLAGRSYNDILSFDARKAEFSPEELAKKKREEQRAKEVAIQSASPPTSCCVVTGERMQARANESTGAPDAAQGARIDGEAGGRRLPEELEEQAAGRSGEGAHVTHGC